MKPFFCYYGGKWRIARKYPQPIYPVIVEATWFIDPPYVGRAGTHYTCGSGEIDYAHLAAWCRSRRGQVIVCENSGAGWLPFAPLVSARATPRAGVDRRSAEAIWEVEQ